MLDVVAGIAANERIGVRVYITSTTYTLVVVVIIFLDHFQM